MKTKTPSTKEQLQENIARAQEELNEINNREYKEKGFPFMLSLVGKCFVYKNNSYGGDTPKWDVYKRVLQVFVSKKGFIKIIVEEFSINCYKHAQYEVKSDHVYRPEENPKYPFSGFTTISHTTYTKKLQAFWTEAQSKKSLINYLKKE